ncbi:MAG: hypothetical protein DMF28_10040 [Verrucomicrobia bacterium]|nr:MAG: hypothetical protein DMF28_10040 [Verrucomicrobiota bacterium]
MNTLEQPLRESHEDLIMDEHRISRTESRTPGRALNRFAPRRRWGFPAVAFVISLSGIAVLFYSLRSVFGDLHLPRQEFEGLGIVVCALAYIGIFLWRLSRALERETQQVEASAKPSEISSVVARELNTGK